MDIINTGKTECVVRNHTRGKQYKQLKVSVDPDIASKFKDSCAKSGVSMAAKLLEFMIDFSNIKTTNKQQPDYSTKKKRRAAVQAIIKQLEQIKDSEQDYQGRIPDNLQGSFVFDNSEEFIENIDSAIEILENI